jgi:peptidoglycan/xylan/chitin deacetylase (PgdA/CDA1 family)
MTFDDGPSAEYTPRLLDLLKARHPKATFFLIGQNRNWCAAAAVFDYKVKFTG